MAIPFGLKEDPGRKKEQKKWPSKYSEKVKLDQHSQHRVAAIGENLSSLRFENPAVCQSSEKLPPNIYCISNSKFINCGPTVINVVDGTAKYNILTELNKNRNEVNRRIKVRKGVFTSKRTINAQDIEVVSEDLRDDWKRLLKRLPGVTFNNSSYHQNFIDAMDRNESTNMAEITLRTWKLVLPEFSNIGNLAKTLFSIGHPDIVTYLKP